jgi:predicted nuclease of predicted toxin-antitoxin system
MRLLLDELCPPGIVEALRARGHDVVSLHDPSHRHLRGVSDEELLAAAAVDGRMVVTDNARHFLPLHRQFVARGRTGHGIVLFTNRSFPRHRPDVFVRALVAALDVLLAAEDRGRRPDGRVVWLSPT